MFSLILTSALFTCAEGQYLIDGALSAKGMTATERIEVISVLLEVTPDHCEYDFGSTREFLGRVPEPTET